MVVVVFWVVVLNFSVKDDSDGVAVGSVTKLLLVVLFGVVVLVISSFALVMFGSLELGNGTNLISTSLSALESSVSYGTSIAVAEDELPEEKFILK